ncbi:MAG: histidine phosphatase family protein [Litoreibacter sp.]
MKLILLRHAKSSWDDLSLSDHDRPLNDRGRGDAQAIGRWLEHEGHTPIQITCSTAIRAAETCEIVCSQMSTPPDVKHISGLYHAGPDRILREIRKYSDETLMIVGHNPGFADIAGMLVTTSPKHAHFHRYPTASTLVLECGIPRWSDLKLDTNQVIDFVTPRDLSK